MINIKILGTGCPKCNKLADSADKAARELGIEYQLEKVTDIAEITAHGVMMTPAVMIDGVMRCQGRVPKADEIRSWLAES